MKQPLFTPAPTSLTPEQLTARQERERSATNAVATLMSNGPAPSPESLALMQRYVDGELSIDQVIELTDAMLLARHQPPAGAEANAQPAR